MTNTHSAQHDQILIRKASGEDEAFSEEKLRRSLFNAGARPETVDHIINDLKSWIYHGITSRRIYAHAFDMLRKERTAASLRYRLKHAILELGPTGYPFERFIGLLFEHMGYSTEVGVVVPGNCVTHEMDVIATRESLQHLVECKYHKDQGSHVGVQVPLYVRSRVNDIIHRREAESDYAGFSFKGWVVTNTRFSEDARAFGECAGLNLLAWNYPAGKGLKEQIESYRIYPVTVLKSLSLKDKQALMNRGVVTCEQLWKDKHILERMALGTTKIRPVMRELAHIYE